MSRPVRLLCVCTHNRTRSVLMGAMLQFHLEQEGVDAEVATAGTHGDGLPAMGQAVEMLARWGVDVHDHRSRRIDPELVEEADLVLTAERGHVVWIAGSWPGTFSRTYTLPELVDRAEPVGPRGERNVGAWLAAVGEGRMAPFEYLDSDGIPQIADPTGQARSLWVRAFREIDDLTGRLARMLA